MEDDIFIVLCTMMCCSSTFAGKRFLSRHAVVVVPTQELAPRLYYKYVHWAKTTLLSFSSARKHFSWQKVENVVVLHVTTWTNYSPLRGDPHRRGTSRLWLPNGYSS
jgi:hypothetical protein